MPDQHKPGGPALSRELKATARAQATEAVQSIVAGLGGRTVLEVRSRSLTWPGVNGMEPEPLASLEAARELERAAHALQLGFIRLSRETGRSWSEIGDSLDLPWEAVVAKESIADMAYDYALSYQPDPAPGRRTFTWTCPACQQPITDHGPWPDLPNQQDGHKTDCPRWSAQLDQWQANQADL